MSTSASKHIDIPNGLYDKTSEHLAGQLLLGEVTAVHMLGDALVLYYADNHSAMLHPREDGSICVHDHKVNEC